MLEDLMYRCEKVVRTNYRRPTQATPVICFSSFSFRISKTNYPEVEPGLTVFVQGFLHEGGAKECCCTETQESDPARRFILRIAGPKLSRPYFVRARGDKTAQEINTLVDLLEGVKKDDAINRTPRKLPFGMTKSGLRR
jgi:hypothetical protein